MITLLVMMVALFWALSMGFYFDPKTSRTGRAFLGTLFLVFAIWITYLLIINVL